MVSQKNVGYTDQLFRMVLAVGFVFIFFMDLVPFQYNLLLLVLSAGLMYTAVLESCEAYRWLGIKTNEKASDIPLEEAVEKLVGVVAVYVIVLLLRFYFV